MSLNLPSCLLLTVLLSLLPLFAAATDVAHRAQLSVTVNVADVCGCGCGWLFTSMYICVYICVSTSMYIHICAYSIHIYL